MSRNIFYATAGMPTIPLLAEFSRFSGLLLPSWLGSMKSHCH